MKEFDFSLGITDGKEKGVVKNIYEAKRGEIFKNSMFGEPDDIILVLETEVKKTLEDDTEYITFIKEYLNKPNGKIVNVKSKLGKFLKKYGKLAENMEVEVFFKDGVGKIDLD